MQTRHIVHWSLGALAGAAVYFALTIVQDLTTGVPCNASAISALQNVVHRARTNWPESQAGSLVQDPYGIICVDDWDGPGNVEFLFQILFTALAGAVAAYIGPSRSAARGALTASVAASAYSVIMHLWPHVEMLAYIWPELVIVACIAAAAGYAGAWFATRSFRKTKRV